jgi:hypothetical protein
VRGLRDANLCMCTFQESESGLHFPTLPERPVWRPIISANNGAYSVARTRKKQKIVVKCLCGIASIPKVADSWFTRRTCLQGDMMHKVPHSFTDFFKCDNIFGLPCCAFCYHMPSADHSNSIPVYSQYCAAHTPPFSKKIGFQGSLFGPLFPVRDASSVRHCPSECCFQFRCFFCSTRPRQQKHGRYQSPLTGFQVIYFRVHEYDTV